MALLRHAQVAGLNVAFGKSGREQELRGFLYMGRPLPGASRRALANSTRGAPLARTHDLEIFSGKNFPLEFFTPVAK